MFGLTFRYVHRRDTVTSQPKTAPQSLQTQMDESGFSKTKSRQGSSPTHEGPILVVGGGATDLMVGGHVRYDLEVTVRFKVCESYRQSRET